MKKTNSTSGIFVFSIINLILLITVILTWRIFQQTKISTRYYLAVSLIFAATLVCMVLFCVSLYSHHQRGEGED